MSLLAVRPDLIGTLGLPAGPVAGLGRARLVGAVAALAVAAFVAPFASGSGRWITKRSPKNEIRQTRAGTEGCCWRITRFRCPGFDSSRVVSSGASSDAASASASSGF